MRLRRAKDRMRWNRAATCPHKVRFDTRAEAEAAMAKMSRPGKVSERDRPRLEVYRCGACGGGWHLGRSTVRNRSA